MERHKVIIRPQGAALKEHAMKGVFLLSSLLGIAALLLICMFLFANGVPAMGKIGVFKFLTGLKWAPNDIPQSFGILPMIVGSVYVTAGAVAAGVPLGIFTAVFMAHMCPKRLYKLLKPAVSLLAGIPSVVYGFFGMAVIVPAVRELFDCKGKNVLSASLLLGLMILPTIISVTEAALRAVPRELYEGGLALGASRERTIFAVVLPAAKSGVAASVALGVGRAIGETMAVIMVAGNQPRVPNGLFDGVRTLTANIVLEMGYAAELHREALIATGVVLFVFILLINGLFAAIKAAGVRQ